MKSLFKKYFLSIYLLIYTLITIYIVYSSYQKNGYIDEALVVAYVVNIIMVMIIYFVFKNKNKNK